MWQIQPRWWLFQTVCPQSSKSQKPRSFILLVRVGYCVSPHTCCKTNLRKMNPIPQHKHSTTLTDTQFPMCHLNTSAGVDSAGEKVNTDIPEATSPSISLLNFWHLLFNLEQLSITRIYVFFFQNFLKLWKLLYSKFIVKCYQLITIYFNHRCQQRG